MVNHWDIEQAFVYSEIDREIFLPDGYVKLSGGAVKLNKSFYGLRQSPRLFNQLLIYL